MSRPRAGNALTYIRGRGDRLIPIIQRSNGKWITTGEAVGWTRCSRCRRPDQDYHKLDDGRVVCNMCYWYKLLPGGATEFWRRSKEYLFPYNIGSRGMKVRPPDTIRELRAALDRKEPT